MRTKNGTKLFINKKLQGINIFTWLFILLVFASHCKKLPYVPAEDAVIYIEAIPSTIAAGDSARIIVTGEKGTGYPLPDGTIVYLSASRGSLDPEVILNNGRAEALFQSDNNFTGEVTITARCGKALISPEQLIITITKTGVSYLYITAEPMELPSAGGTSRITAKALDENMEPAEGKRLWLETTAGTLSPAGEQVSDGNGEVESLLTTDKPAAVTVKYGEVEQSVDITLEAGNILPIADFVYSPTAPTSGEEIHFNAEASSDEDGTIAAYHWDLGDGAKKKGKTISHVYYTDEKRVFVVTLKVADNEGGEGVESKEITVEITQEEENKLPTASFVYSPTTPKSGEEVYFNARQSTDEDGYIVSFQWDFGDGTTGSGETFSHTYVVDENRIFAVTLKVVDDRGGEDVDSKEITIEKSTEENKNPTAAFVYSPKSPKSGEKVYFNAEESSDEDGYIVSYEWDFGDGTQKSGENVNHRYNVGDTTTVTVTLKVVDDKGGEDIESKEITITADEENINPSASFDYSPKPAKSGETVYFNAETSTDEDGEIVFYQWDFGDGNTTSGEKVTHTYIVTESKTFIVTLKVTDDRGGEDVDTKEITVEL